MSETGIEPFHISAADDVLSDLRERLARTRFPGEAPDSGWQYGTNLSAMQQLVAYWRDSYDWRAAEARLNQMPQFRADVNGLRLHFVHQRGAGPAPLREVPAQLSIVEQPSYLLGDGVKIKRVYLQSGVAHNFRQRGDVRY